MRHRGAAPVGPGRVPTDLTLEAATAAAGGPLAGSGGPAHEARSSRNWESDHSRPHTRHRQLAALPDTRVGCRM